VGSTTTHVRRKDLFCPPADSFAGTEQRHATDSGKISDADVEEYYKKNEANYDQATFNRIIVPRTKQFVPPAAAKPKPGAKIPTTPPPQTEAQKKAGEDAMTKLADAIGRGP